MLIKTSKKKIDVIKNDYGIKIVTLLYLQTALTIL
jgi:hypothetical protein